MKTFALAFVLTLLGPSVFAQYFDWAGNIGGEFSDGMSDIARDSEGNVYYTGFYQGTADLDPGASTSNFATLGLIDFFIVKTNANGVYQWAKGLGGAGFDYGNDILIDSNGNVLVTGSFEQTVDFDPGPGIYNLTSAGNSDVFVLKLDANGNFLWARRTGGVGADAGSNITIAPNGNVFYTGSFRQTADFDPDSSTQFELTSAGGSDIVISCLTSAGQFQWAKQLGGTSTEVGAQIICSKQSHLLLAGSFLNTLDADPGVNNVPITAVGNTDVFVIRISTAGDFEWVKSFGGQGGESASMCLDPNGDICLAGRFSGTSDFDPGPNSHTLTATGTTFDDIFVMKLTAAGNFSWAVRMGGAYTDYATRISTDGSGNIYTTGDFSGTVDFDPGVATYNLTAAGPQGQSSDIFISKLSTQGAFVSGMRIGSSSIDVGRSIMADDVGNVWIAGTFTGTVDFDPGSSSSYLSSHGDIDIFMTRFFPVFTGIVDQAAAPGIGLYPNPWKSTFSVQLHEGGSPDLYPC